MSGSLDCKALEPGPDGKRTYLHLYNRCIVSQERGLGLDSGFGLVLTNRNRLGPKTFEKGRRYRIGFFTREAAMKFYLDISSVDDFDRMDREGRLF